MNLVYAALAVRSTCSDERVVEVVGGRHEVLEVVNSVLVQLFVLGSPPVDSCFWRVFDDELSPVLDHGASHK